MSTHDYVIENQTGANTRSDLNNAFSAIVSNNSSATEPSTTYAFMWWADTTNDLLKQRNAANSAWISILTLSTGTPSAGGGDVVDDTTPQLGGDLDVNGNSIVSASNGDIAITPNGTGNVVVDGIKYPQSDGTSGQLLQTDGAGQLSFADAAGGGGKILQIVRAKSSTALTVGTSYATISGTSIAITPVAANSTFLYVYSTRGYTKLTNNVTAQLIKTESGSDTLMSEQQYYTNIPDYQVVPLHFGLSYVDQTSYTFGNSLTYFIKIKRGSEGETRVNDAATTNGVSSYIMEIGA